MSAIAWSKPVGKLGRKSAAVVVVAAAMTLAACSSSTKSATPQATATGSSSASGGASTAAAATGTPYVVGSIISETGAASAQYAVSAGELTAWAKWTNAHGGVNGHPVQLVIKDDQSSPSAGIQAANELVAQHVFALVEGGSGVAPSWAPTIQKAGIPVVGGDPSAAPPWGTYANMYGTTASAAADADIYMKAVVAAGKSKVGVLYCKEVAACAAALSAFQVSAKKYGVQVIGEAVSLSAASYAAPCLALKSSGAEVGDLLLTPNVDDAVLTQCSQQGWKPQWIKSTFEVDDATNPLLVNFLGFIENFPWFADTPVATTYRAAMTQYYPAALKNQLTVGPIMWATGLLFQEGVKLGKLGDNPTAAQLTDGLNMISNDTLGGATPPLTFTNGNRTMNCTFQITGQNGMFMTANNGNPICGS